ncbi:MAG: hypothetical protein JXX29_10140 [Deltaproteobacteria bacterium]|nr:hypothetical protein [Deltaproteobacteria bacterium]MBN2672025.1 hypothetical protein [Deltaproteobacteria bacterium]
MLQFIENDDRAADTDTATETMLGDFDAETDRTRSSSNFGECDLREYYLVPFGKCIREANAQLFMTAYNAVNGIPAAGPSRFPSGFNRF